MSPAHSAPTRIGLPVVLYSWRWVKSKLESEKLDRYALLRQPEPQIGSPREEKVLDVVLSTADSALSCSRQGPRECLPGSGVLSCFGLWPLSTLAGSSWPLQLHSSLSFPAISSPLAFKQTLLPHPLVSAQGAFPSGSSSLTYNPPSFPHISQLSVCSCSVLARSQHYSY